MAQIAIDFIEGRDLSSRLIAYFGQGAGGYSHCASVLADGRYLDARSDVLDHVPAGVHIRKPESERWVKKRRATLQVTQEEYDAWEVGLRAKIGDAYGRSDIFGFIEARNMHESGHYICSALAINELQHIKKVPFPLPIAAHQISPDAALLIVATAGFTIGPEQINP